MKKEEIIKSIKKLSPIILLVSIFSLTILLNLFIKNINLKEFQNETFNFKYPNNWQVSELPDQVLVSYTQSNELDTSVASNENVKEFEDASVLFSKKNLDDFRKELNIIDLNKDSYCDEVQTLYETESYNQLGKTIKKEFIEISNSKLNGCKVIWNFEINFNSTKLEMISYTYYLFDEINKQIIVATTSSSKNNLDNLNKSLEIIETSNLIK